MSRCSPPSPLDDCNKDPSYIPLPATPPQEGMSQTYSTPPGHRPGSKTTTAAKKKLSEVATVPNRCLVTLAEQPLEHCHIIPRTIRLEKVSTSSFIKVSAHALDRCGSWRLHGTRNLEASMLKLQPTCSTVSHN